MINWDNFFCKFVSNDEIQNQIDTIIELHKININKAIDVELLIEKVGLIVNPHKLDWIYDAIYLHSLNEIVVNIERYTNDRYYKRLRFSLAHELGHYFLHQKYIELFDFSSVEDYYSFVEKIPEKQYKRFETQANVFAGKLIVNKTTLENKIIEYKNKNWVIDENLIPDLSSFFEVSDEVIVRRLQNENISMNLFI